MNAPQQQLVVGSEVKQAPTPADLVQYALAHEIDFDQIEKMYAIQRQWESDQARKSYTVAMTKFKTEPLTIEKTKFVGYDTKDGDKVGYSHAELAGIVAVVMPAMARHGLSHRWNVTQDGQVITVECIITHSDGHSETVKMHGLPDDSGKKNKIQQVASTVTYLQRYTLMAACGVAAGDIDDDGKGSEEDPEEKKIADEWRAAIQSCKSVEELKAKKVDFIDDYKGYSNVPDAVKAAYLDALHALKEAGQ